MKSKQLDELLQAYRNAPQEFQATRYWASYEKRILDAIAALELDQLRSGQYPILRTFGFNDVVFPDYSQFPIWQRGMLKWFHRDVLRNRAVLPYRLRLSNIQEMAYHHCELVGKLSRAIPVGALEASTFGNPPDLFEMGGRAYTMLFLDYYLRYCFSQKHVGYQGDEIIVELGSGSGYQVEVLKKLYPRMTILCFDMPAQIFLCEQYLAQALGPENIVGTEVTLRWQDLSGLKKGGVHFLGNWQVPLLRGFRHDVFWNAASFGEMEPAVVANYLSYIKGSAAWIYLLQARHGKETAGATHVEKPIALDDYRQLLSGYALQEEQDAWRAQKRLSESGGYFESMWSRN